MGTEQAHLEQARANYDLAEQLSSEFWSHRQWACTMYFYSAVHSIEAAWASGLPNKPPPRSYPSRHDWREAWMDMNCPSLAAPFKKLRKASQRVRYELGRPGAEEVSRRQVDAHNILTRAESQQLIT